MLFLSKSFVFSGFTKKKMYALENVYLQPRMSSWIINLLNLVIKSSWIQITASRLSYAVGFLGANKSNEY